MGSECDQEQYADQKDIRTKGSGDGEFELERYSQYIEQYKCLKKKAVQHFIHGLSVVGAVIAKAATEDIANPCSLNPLITECLLSQITYEHLISNLKISD
ncbi:MAG: hypothetical protein EZS28_026911 [Streblomastix strix]|uniref:Uncharacterized protein n=1 Tax=Streblomastix strix TaxID=222440 RepID=A0A5J4V479_9EUKA|nr:MAG: hypothetical protein EZS28_026911 [Streblomastix strix]